jgi:hypothetical protein
MLDQRSTRAIPVENTHVKQLHAVQLSKRKCGCSREETAQFLSELPGFDEFDVKKKIV